MRARRRQERLLSCRLHWPEREARHEEIGGREERTERRTAGFRCHAQSRGFRKAKVVGSTQQPSRAHVMAANAGEVDWGKWGAHSHSFSITSSVQWVGEYLRSLLCVFSHARALHVCFYALALIHLLLRRIPFLPSFHRSLFLPSLSVGGKNPFCLRRRSLALVFVRLVQPSSAHNGMSVGGLVFVVFVVVVARSLV